jgi:hypothetical protein
MDDGHELLALFLLADKQNWRERGETSEQDLFRSRLDQIIDMKHALVKLARAIDGRFWRRVGAVYTDKPGRRHCRRG